MNTTMIIINSIVLDIVKLFFKFRKEKFKVKLTYIFPAFCYWFVFTTCFVWPLSMVKYHTFWMSKTEGESVYFSAFLISSTIFILGVIFVIYRFKILMKRHGKQNV